MARCHDNRRARKRRNRRWLRQLASQELSKRLEHRWSWQLKVWQGIDQMVLEAASKRMRIQQLESEMALLGQTEEQEEAKEKVATR